MSSDADADWLAQDSEVDINRREHQRHKVRLAVNLASDSNLFVGFADNMSEGGLFVATHELIPIGTRVELEFRLPEHDEPICVEGEVCWHRAVNDPSNRVLPGFGARFVELDNDDRERIEQFLETREPIFHPQ